MRLAAGKLGAANACPQGVFALRDGNDTDKAKPEMITTRPHKDTIIAPLKRDPRFAWALSAEAANRLGQGQSTVALPVLDARASARITCPQLTRPTRLGENTLHRMLSRHANPTARDLRRNAH